MNCKNCKEKLDGKYCSNCGQSDRVGKIDLPYLFNELSTTVFQLNHGFLYTIKQLFIAPGKTIKQFIEGERKSYFKPIAYVLLLSTVYALIANLIDEKTIIGDAFTGWNNGYKDSTNSSKDISHLNWFVNNYAYTTLILLPFFSLASYLAFLESKFNYFEHFVLNSYLTGQQAIIYSVFIIFKSVFGENFFTDAFPVALSLGFVFWTFIQFFKKDKIYQTILFTILTYFIFITIFASIIFLSFLAIKNAL